MGNQTTTTAAAQSGTAATEPKPASIAELKAAFPSNPGFALEAAEQALTLTEAKAKYADVLAADNARLAEQNATLKQQQAAAAANPPKLPGNAPVGGGAAATATAGGVTAGEQFRALVDEKMKAAGMARQRAVSAVARENPELHRQWLAEANPGKQIPQS